MIRKFYREQYVNLNRLFFENLARADIYFSDYRDLINEGRMYA